MVKERRWNFDHNQRVHLEIDVLPLDCPLLANAVYCEWCPSGFDFLITAEESLQQLNPIFLDKTATFEGCIAILHDLLWTDRLDYYPVFVDWETPPTAWILKGLEGNGIKVTLVGEEDG